MFIYEFLILQIYKTKHEILAFFIKLNLDISNTITTNISL